MPEAFGLSKIALKVAKLFLSRKLLPDILPQYTLLESLQNQPITWVQSKRGQVTKIYFGEVERPQCRGFWVETPVGEAMAHGVGFMLTGGYSAMIEYGVFS